MNETPQQEKTRIAGYMAAVAKLLRGADGNDEAFRNKVELIVGGSAANAPTLLHWAERTRRTGLPMLLFSPTNEPAVPLVTLVAHVDGQTYIVENCVLWMGTRNDRARLIPDTFDLPGSSRTPSTWAASRWTKTSASAVRRGHPPGTSMPPCPG